MSGLSTAALLDILAAELRRGRVYEARLFDEHWHLSGLCDHERDAVIIDPVPATIGTLLHELLHRRFPTWSERRVAQVERRLLRSLDRETLGLWWRRYLRVRRRRRPVTAELQQEG